METPHKLQHVEIGAPFAEIPEGAGLRILVAGPSGCGKTNLMLYLLANGYLGNFDERILISPSSGQSMYRAVDWTAVGDEYSPEAIERILYKAQQRVASGLETKTLVFLDDIVGEASIHYGSKTSALVRLFVRGRPLHVSAIVLTQQLYAIPNTVRLQCSIVLMESQRREQEAGYETFGWGTKREFLKACTDCYTVKYRPYIWIQPNNRHFFGLDRELIVSQSRAMEASSTNTTTPAATPLSADEKSPHQTEGEVHQSQAPRTTATARPIEVDSSESSDEETEMDAMIKALTGS